MGSYVSGVRMPGPGRWPPLGDSQGQAPSRRSLSGAWRSDAQALVDLKGTTATSPGASSLAASVISYWIPDQKGHRVRGASGSKRPQVSETTQDGRGTRSR